MDGNLFIPLLLGTSRIGRESEKVAKYVFAKMQDRETGRSAMHGLGQSKSLLTNVISALVTLAMLGCSSGSGQMPQGHQAVESFSSMRASLGRAQVQVDKVNAALKRLSGGEDIAKSYRSFKDELKDLQSAADDAKQRATAMREREEAFVQRWQGEMATLTDPQLMSTLEQRRAAVTANYEQVRSAGQEVRDAYQPFIDRLMQIEKTLSIDLTRETVEGITPTLQQAHADAETLKQKLAAMQDQLKRIEDGLAAKVTSGS